MKHIFDKLFQAWECKTLPESVTFDALLLDRYDPRKFLGIGGTSVVIAAWDTVLERLVAVKILNPRIVPHQYRQTPNGFCETFDWVSHFHAEARRLASHKHSAICQVFDFGRSHDGVPWIVMEFFEGRTLRDQLRAWVADRSTHRLDGVLAIAEQVLSAAAYLHQHGLYQLDIKPENILVRDGVVKLIDLASAVERPASGYKLHAARYGTPGYLAPEVVASLDARDVGPPADVFSIGVLLLEMCCLHNPLADTELRKSAYEALSVSEIQQFLDYSTAEFIPDWDDDLANWAAQYRSALEDINVALLLSTSRIRVPKSLIELIQNSMQPSPQKRPRTAGDMLHGFASLTHHHGHHEEIPNLENEHQKTRLLLLSADPTDEARLRLGREFREIHEKLRLAQMRDLFIISQRSSVRPADISQAILDEKPSIVHFSGHGTTAGGLCFEDESGRSKVVEPDALASLFEAFPNQVECVILNACYSEPQARAISAHVKYVIGMSIGIGDNAATAFSVGFYQALGAGKSLGEAYKLGVVQIRLQGFPDHTTPILMER